MASVGEDYSRCSDRSLCQNEPISTQQHEFVNSKACFLNLLESSNLLTNSIARKRWLDLLFLDFEKAFDKVSLLEVYAELRLKPFKTQSD